jgi:DNA topoisomerase-3
VLLHSWNDRRTHEFFHERSYPDPQVLTRVFQALGAEAHPADTLARRLHLPADELETALEKLWIHGGARFSSAGAQQLVSRGEDVWLAPYRRQREYRREQLDRIQRFADGHTCRMAALVQHFGDQQDDGRACGACDVCDPGACLVRSVRAPKPREREAARAVLETLRLRDGQSTGRLHAACGGASLERRVFEEVLGGLVRAGLLRVSADEFEKEGRKISFQRAWITPVGRGASPAGLEFTLAEEHAGPAGRGPGGSRGKKRPKPVGRATADSRLVAELKQWRLAESRKRGVPAFRVLRDRTLMAIAAARPRDEAGLLAVPGIGPALLRRHGSRILRICRTRA